MYIPKRYLKNLLFRQPNWLSSCSWCSMSHCQYSAPSSSTADSSTSDMSSKMTRKQSTLLQSYLLQNKSAVEKMLDSPYGIQDMLGRLKGLSKTPSNPSTYPHDDVYPCIQRKDYVILCLSPLKDHPDIDQLMIRYHFRDINRRNTTTADETLHRALQLITLIRENPELSFAPRVIKLLSVIVEQLLTLEGGNILSSRAKNADGLSPALLLMQALQEFQQGEGPFVTRTQSASDWLPREARQAASEWQFKVLRQIAIEGSNPTLLPDYLPPVMGGGVSRAEDKGGVWGVLKDAKKVEGKGGKGAAEGVGGGEAGGTGGGDQGAKVTKQRVSGPAVQWSAPEGLASKPRAKGWERARELGYVRDSEGNVNSAKEGVVGEGDGGEVSVGGVECDDSWFRIDKLKELIKEIQQAEKSQSTNVEKVNQAVSYVVQQITQMLYPQREAGGDKDGMKEGTVNQKDQVEAVDIKVTLHLPQVPLFIVYRHGGMVMCDVQDDVRDVAWEWLHLHGEDADQAEHDVEELSIIQSDSIDEDVHCVYDDEQGLMVKALDLGSIVVASNVLAQSVGMEKLDREVEAYTNEFHKLNERMLKQGHLQLKEQKALQYVARLNMVQTNVTFRLGVMSRDALAWREERYDDVRNALRDELDLDARLEGINQKVAAVMSNAKLMYELVHNRRSEVLEKVIIALIAIEVVLSVYHLYRDSVRDSLELANYV